MNGGAHSDQVTAASEPQPGTNVFRAIGTANHGYGQQAQEEVRRLFETKTSFRWLLPNETFMMEADTAFADGLERIKCSEPVFLRHLQPVNAEVDWDGDEAALLEGIRSVIRTTGDTRSGLRVAVQIRKGERVPEGAAPGQLKPAIDRLLTEEWGAEPVVREADRILSLFLEGGRVYVGWSRPEDNLSDWPGGAVRFRREEGQISRAKFKLLEAELAFGLDFAGYRSALDVGAAPGGWTSLLLERGLEVTAVDPAKLDPSLLRHPRLTYYGKRADEVSFAQGSFDLLVCDMSWSPHQMAKLVLGLADALQQGGTAILTVKLMHKKALQTIREVTGVLEMSFALQKAKQLFHNREELTLFLLKK